MIEAPKPISQFLLHSQRCFIDNHFTDATLHIKGNKIAVVYKGIHKISGIPFSDYGNLIVMPGIIDAHVHINEPGRTHWEGFDTATKAAALGGVTTLVEMPLNASPVTTTAEAFQLKATAAKGKLHVHCGFYGGVVPGNKNDIEPLIKAGVFGIKGFLTHSGIDEFPNVSREDLEVVAPILKKYDIPLLLHCELSDENVPEITDPKSYDAYLQSRPPHWETNAIQLALDIQEKYDTKVHIVHLSAAEGLPLINKHKEKTNRLTVETCPQYLFFNAEAIPDASPLYKCAPPIRNKKNNELLWNAVLNGEINFIASDHSPAPPERKKLEQGDLFEAWGGISGLQFTLPATWTSGKERGLPLEKLIPLLTAHPAKFLGLDHCKGYLKAGYDADITVWDDSEAFTITPESIQHKHKATPYEGHQVFGKVIHTFVHGVKIVEHSNFKIPDQGTLLLRSDL